MVRFGLAAGSLRDSLTGSNRSFWGAAATRQATTMGQNHAPERARRHQTLFGLSCTNRIGPNVLRAPESEKFLYQAIPPGFVRSRETSNSKLQFQDARWLGLGFFQVSLEL